MSALPEPSTYREFLPDVYRFAFLMTGHAGAAADVLRHTVERAARSGVDELRDLRRAKRWLFSEARRQCNQPRADHPVHPHLGSALAPGADGTFAPDGAPRSDGDDQPDARDLARLFAGVPENERSALSLFYLYLFDPVDLADVLEIKLAELAPLLIRARAQLSQMSQLSRQSAARPATEHSALGGAAIAGEMDAATCATG